MHTLKHSLLRNFAVMTGMIFIMPGMVYTVPVPFSPITYSLVLVREGWSGAFNGPSRTQTTVAVDGEQCKVCGGGLNDG